MLSEKDFTHNWAATRERERFPRTDVARRADRESEAVLRSKIGFLQGKTEAELLQFKNPTLLSGIFKYGAGEGT